MPADHEIFQELNAAQWLWYYYNITEDELESFESNRNMIEYLASFIEPEAVRQIISAREKSVEVSDDEFRSTLEKLSGRDISINKNSDGKIHTVDPRTAIQNYKATLQSPISNTDVGYKDWMNMNLE